MIEQLEINWPSHYSPSVCPVHVRNDLTIAAAPEQVWAWLIRATLWPNWYINSAKVHILNNTDLDLKLGTQFRWTTFGVTLNSTVLEYVQNERIAWDARSFGVDAYHAWAIQPLNEGCRVLTEESQHGLLAWLSHFAMPNRMHTYHQIWLEGLAEKARVGFPPKI
jgi:uncharacterized protein YndB with AHSA1/START domain